MARPHVKNKAAAPIQLTAEQILREARDADYVRRPPEQTIADPSELADYRLRHRKDFEDRIRRGGGSGSALQLPIMIKYTRWEESHKDLARARSVWERALIDAAGRRDHTLWLKYADFEIRNRCVNRARCVFDRAVAILPRADQLWQAYAHMEETLGNVAAARCIFERWAAWQPPLPAWNSFADFELRYGELDRARAVSDRALACHPCADAFIRRTRLETPNGVDPRLARTVYERAIDLLCDDADDEEDAHRLLLAFAEFEEHCDEPERARCIYRYALGRTPPKELAEDLHHRFAAFQRRHGDADGIEDTLVSRRRLQCEEAVRDTPLDYDVWFDYIKLEEGAGGTTGKHCRVREVYERAVANVPPAEEKRYWRRYIFFWISYALYEELDAEDTDRAREVYRRCLCLIPHAKFTCAKVWILAAKFEIRNKNLGAARRILGNAIGVAPREKTFVAYIETELQLGNVDRCRTIYGKYLEWDTANCRTWIKYARLERSLGETERARAVLELAVGQPALDMPEFLWKAYIDLEISEGEYERTRKLYERLLNRSKHVKVWTSYAMFEASALPEEDNNDDNARQVRIRRARAVFERALDYFRTAAPHLKDQRVVLLEEWLNIEASFGSDGDVVIVRSKLPRKLKRKRAVLSDDATPVVFKEYFDYIFSDEVAGFSSNLKILEAACLWKKQRKAGHNDA